MDDLPVAGNRRGTRLEWLTLGVTQLVLWSFAWLVFARLVWLERGITLLEWLWLAPGLTLAVFLLTVFAVVCFGR